MMIRIVIFIIIYMILAYSRDILQAASKRRRNHHIFHSMTHIFSTGTEIVKSIQMMYAVSLLWLKVLYPSAGTRHKNDVGLTSMQRDDVAST